MNRFFLLLIFSSLFCSAAFADEELISDDGREILLKDDGTWEFISTDRFANTKDGRRVRLMDNGSWVYIGNAPLVTKEQARTTTVDIRLEKIEFEVHKEKILKNVRKESQTVFYINVDVSPLARTSLTIKDTNLSLISVMDDRGNDYPVLSITPSNTEIAPDRRQTFVIRAEDAPSLWDGAKLIEILIQPSVFGNQEPIKFSRKYHDIEEVNVRGFEKNK